MTVVVGAPVVALVGRAERVSVAAAAAVRERATLTVVDAPVEPQHAVVARTGVLRQTTQLCQNNNEFLWYPPSTYQTCPFRREIFFVLELLLLIRMQPRVTQDYPDYIHS